MHGVECRKHFYCWPLWHIIPSELMSNQLWRRRKNATKSIKMSIDFVIWLCGFSLIVVKFVPSSICSIRSHLLLFILHSSFWRHTDSSREKLNNKCGSLSSFPTAVSRWRIHSNRKFQYSSFNQPTKQHAQIPDFFSLSHTTIIINTMVRLLVGRAFSYVQIFGRRMEYSIFRKQ